MRRNTCLSVDRLEERLALSSAPLLDTSVPLSMLEIAEDAGSPQGAVGTPVARLIDHGGSLNNFSDADGDVPGIAITQTATQGGTLWSSTDDGVTWEPVEGVSASNPEVLFATPGNRLYFEPAPNFNGVIDELFSFRAVGVSADAVPTFDRRELGDALPQQSPAPWFGGDMAVSRDGLVSVAAWTTSTITQVGLQLNVQYFLNVATTAFDSGLGSLVRGSLSVPLVRDGNNLQVSISADGTEAIVGNRTADYSNETHATDIFYIDIRDPAFPLITEGPVRVNYQEGGRGLERGQWLDAAFSANGEVAIVQTAKQSADSLSEQLAYEVIDLTNSSSPESVASFQPFLSTDVYGRKGVWLSRDGSKGLVGGYQTFLTGIDLAVKSQPVVGKTKVLERIFSKGNFSSDGDLFFAIEEDSGLLVFDVSDVLSPRLLSRVDVAQARNLVVVEELAIVLVPAGNGRVTMVDVRTPQSPFVLGVQEVFPLPYGSRSVVDLLYSQAADSAVVWSDAGSSVGVGSVVTFVGGSLGAFSVRSGSVGISVSAVDDVSVVDGGQSGVLNTARVAGSTLRVTDADGLGGYGVFALQTPPQHGSAVVFDGSGQWLYYAGPSFAGEDQFTIRITDVAGGYTDRVISVTGEPSRTIGFLANMVIHQSYSTSAASYSLPPLGPEGELLDGKVARITATSSNTALIPHPTPIYASADIPESISFTPVIDASGMATISIQVEDGGADNDLGTAEDNGRATHQIEVKVLEVISSASGVVLSKDEGNHIYAATQPIMLEQQQAPALIAGFAAIGAEEGNVLLVERGGTTSRLVAEEGWSIRDLFHSLRNNSSAILNPVSRDPKEFSLAAISGAYQIDGLENPTIIVRRGQRVTFDLNVIGHPFYLQTTGGGYVPANVYSEGFTGNGETTGRFEWIVPEEAPDELFYQCEFHPVMFGKIIVLD